MEKELEMSLIVLTLTACNYQLKHLIKIVTRVDNFLYINNQMQIAPRCYGDRHL